MKKLLTMACCCALLCSGYSQGQELEQLKLNLEKLAQLKLMLAQAKRGYEVMARGYDAMRDAARGNFRQHQQYLEQLLTVGPSVRSAPALRRLERNVAQVGSVFEDWRRRLVPLGLLSVNEWSGLQRRYELITAGAASVSDQAATLLTPGALRMSDGERIAALTLLTEKSEAYLRDLQRLIDEQTLIAARSAQQKNDAAALRKLYGLH
jgi:hypothetical protein